MHIFMQCVHRHYFPYQINAAYKTILHVYIIIRYNIIHYHAEQVPFELTLLDSARFLNYRILFLLLGYCPLFERTASALLLLVFKLRPPPPSSSACACPWTGRTIDLGQIQTLCPAAAAVASEALRAEGRIGHQTWRAGCARLALLALVVGGVLCVWAMAVGMLASFAVVVADSALQRILV